MDHVTIEKKQLLLLKKCQKEIEERRSLHRRLARLKGRIRVFARIRPVIPEDGDQAVVVNVDEFEESTVTMEWKGSKKNFTVDKAFGPQCLQREICIVYTVYVWVCTCVYCMYVVHPNSFTYIWPSVHIPSHHNISVHAEVHSGACCHSICVLPNSLFTDI